jgi:hypothetical protein
VRLRELVESASECSYLWYPYTSLVRVEMIVEFEDAGETAVTVELDADEHRDIVEYVTITCTEHEDE